jgi:hypothetical protein
MQKLRQFWIHALRISTLALLLGWLLADYQLPLWACWITLGLMAHLAIAGADAIFLAVVWLTIWLWVAVFKFAWPISLQPGGWSSWVMVAWVLNLVLVSLVSMGLGLAIVQTQRSLMKALNSQQQTRQILVILTWASFGVGWMINYMGDLSALILK